MQQLTQAYNSTTFSNLHRLQPPGHVAEVVTSWIATRYTTCKIRLSLYVYSNIVSNIASNIVIYNNDMSIAPQKANSNNPNTQQEVRCKTQATHFKCRRGGTADLGAWF